jgi:hypothetical protein
MIQKNKANVVLKQKKLPPSWQELESFMKSKIYSAFSSSVVSGVTVT